MLYSPSPQAGVSRFALLHVRHWTQLSLVDNVSLGLRLLPSGSGCLSPEGDGLQPASSVHFHALEKEMAIHSSVLAWRIPRMGEPGGLPSMGLRRVGHN